MQGRSSKLRSAGVVWRRLAPSLSLSSLPLVLVAGVLAAVVPAGASGQNAGAPSPAPGATPAVTGPELKELRTSHTRTFADPSGLQRLRVYPRPIHFENSGGRWQTIDNRLVPTADGFENAAARVDVKLPDDVASGVSVAQGEHFIAFAPEDAEGSASTRGATADYEDVMPEVDMRYTALPDGVKEDIVLRGPEAPTTYTFSLRTSPGLSAREDGANGIRFEDDEGRVVANVAPPFMTDTSGEDEGYSDDVDLQLEPAPGGYRLTVSADPSWVRRELRDGPVVIDPTVRFTPAAPGCKIQSGTQANINFCSAPEIDVGSNLDDNPNIRKRRSLLRFTISRWLPKGSEIYEATLNAKSFARQTTAAMAVNAHEVSRAWTRGVTWNRYDGTNAWASPGGSFDAAVLDSNASVGDTLGWESWNVTAAVQRWADGAASGFNDGGHGLLLKQSNEDTIVNEVDFHSSDAASSADWPYLTILYDNLTGELPYYSFEQDERLTDRLSMKVNVASGNLILREDDLSVKGTLLDLGVSRFYNGREPATDQLGWGWTQTIGRDQRLRELANGNVAFSGPSGYVKAFRRQPDGSYVKPQGVNATLTKNAGGTWTMKWNQSDTTWRFDSAGFVTEQSERNGRKISLVYDANRKVSQLTDTQGRITRFAYNSSGRMTSMTDSAGRVHTYAYTGLEMTSYTDPAGKVTRYGYGVDEHGQGELTSVTDPQGKVTSFTYDDDRRITSVTRGGHRTNYAYAQGGTPCADAENTVVTDPRGNATTYCWDDRGRVDEVHDALGRKRSTGFDSRSNVIQTQGPGGGAGGYSTNGTFDSNDNLTAVQQPGSDGNTGARSEFTYGTGSEAFKLKGSTDSQGGQRDYAYDGDGDLTRVGTTTGAGAAEDQVKLQYNGKADGDCADQSGRPKGTIRCSIDGNGNRTLYEHDTAGNLTKVIPPAPLGAITYTYDNLSRQATMTDGKGQRRSFTYDARDRVTRVEFRNAGGTVASTVSYAYDGDGNLVSRSDATGQTTYTYDSRNNLTEEDFPGDSGTRNNYAYDPTGNLQSFIDAQGMVLYDYNEVNLLARLTEPGGAQTTYGYNDDDSRTRTSFPNGVTETRTYDRGERPKSIRATNTSGAVLTDFGYDYLRTGMGSESDLIQRMTDAQRGTSTSYGYDHLSRLTSQATTGSATENYSYTYDAASNRVQSTEPSGTRSYAYNAANQLCWVAAGTPTRNCGAAPTGSTTYQWDPNGNLTYSSDGYAFAYNAQNQTASLTAPGQATQQMGFLDTGQTDLVQRGPTGYLNNALAAGQSIGRRGGDEYTRDNGGQLQSQKNTGGRSYYLTDAHPGSVAAMTNSAGNVAVRYRYGPFGDDRGQIGSLGNSLRFASQEYMPALGITKMGERFYLPKIGRWTQQDPLNQTLDPRQANRYTYAAADPINSVDPTGLLTNTAPGRGSSFQNRSSPTKTDIITGLDVAYTALSGAADAAGCVASLQLGPWAPAGCGVVLAGSALADRQIDKSGIFEGSRLRD